MKIKRSLVVTRRVLRQLRRDRRSIAVTLLQPILIMAIFGYAFGGDITDAPVAVANLDRGVLGREILSRIDPSVADLVHFETDTAVERAVLAQEVRVGIVIPFNFTRNLESARSGGAPETAFIIIFKDNTNPQITGAVLAEFGDALAATFKDNFDNSGSFDFDERVVFGGAEERSLDFFVPGIAAYAIFMLGSMLTVVSVVKERNLGTIDRLLASPITRGEIVTGFALAFGVFSALQGATVLAIATLVFGVNIVGSVTLALATTTLVGVMSLGLGILLSGIAANENQAIQSVFLIAFPALFLAGIFAPLEALPSVMRPFSQLVPLTYAVDALRAIINHGFGLAAIALDLLVLIAFAALFLGGAAASFGRGRY